MWRSTEPKPPEPFRQWLDRLARPIEFASRDACAHLPNVKNLGSFVSSQVMQTLSEHVYPRAVEAALLKLRALFADDVQLSLQERQARLQEAIVIVKALRGMERDSDRAWHEPEPVAVVRGERRSEPQALWTLPIRYVKGVGPKRTALLQRLGIETVEQALWTIPWRYEDRSVMTPIGQLTPGMPASICGTIVRSDVKRAKHRRLTILDVYIEDTTGRMQAVFFNQPYLETLLTVGTRVMMSGRVVAGARGWVETRMEVSQYEVVGSESENPLHVGRIVPIYHETKGWTSRQMRLLIRDLLDAYLDNLQEILPIPVRARQRLPPYHQAVEEIHFPKRETQVEQLERGTSPAHRRLAFEELFVFQLALAMRRRSVQEETKTVRFNPKTPGIRRLARALPFTLTDAQQRVIREILDDMGSPRPMNRLVQGDVGCGKTIVALHAMVLACGSGYQAALMAPTEILAEQHYRNMKGLLESLGLSIVLVSGRGRGAQRKATRELVRSGRAHVAIGTHALIQEGVTFSKLGLAVIDEQHRFGVLQRKNLGEKGYKPDVLVLTATPIPRTLAMTVYGDLDVSTIDQMPPARKPVRTFLYSEFQRSRAYQVVKDELRAGRQAYVVYPLVEESEKTDLRAAMQGAEQLQRGELADFKVAVLHGRMKPEEKDRVMTAFKNGAVQVLVSTTVVEVGVDVANATVIMIEHAERFGLAQLHQLRGRVGRSERQSYCLLMASRTVGVVGGKARSSGEPASAARARLEALVRSTDGFVIAEEDLRIRGPGEMFGLRQWGMPEFHVANVARDADILLQARHEAVALLKLDSHLNAPMHRGLKEAVHRRWEKKLDLGSVS
ncbi:ATP-dependent DNA helicase RecG [Nitrospira sp. KM1]|uniref:ATP-dependent DNA helicase RecG n=1 Tax=Nitrospira sp. KM1 TaxID=1936990 RepID=UPI0013A724EE|nr:ATP-dependent DNA helicase RecG [Nitrospira sp. KM1]BCA56854.1 ATP-dependent DNA helicase RecG [Nitrospira sp. KM1]